MTTPLVNPLLEQYVLTRSKGMPLIAIDTLDEFETMMLCSSYRPPVSGEPILLGYDLSRGLYAPENKLGAIAEILRLYKDQSPDILAGLKALSAPSVGGTAKKYEEPAVVLALSKVREKTKMQPQDTFWNLLRASAGTTIFVHNAHRILPDPGVAQAVQNFRDEFRQNHRALVLMGPAVELPPQLKHDVLKMDHPLPTRQELQQLVREELGYYNEEIAKKANGKSGKDKPTPVSIPDAPTMDKIVDVLRGLSIFPAGQAIQMSIRPTGIHIPQLWTRKDQLIQDVNGLSLMRGPGTLKDLVGLKNLSSYTIARIQGRSRCTLVAVFDEIDKDVAAVEGDNTGVAQETYGAILKDIVKYEIPVVFISGMPGVGKTYSALCIANETQINAVEVKLSEMKTKELGGSMQNYRTFFKTLMAIADGRPLFIMTCNRPWLIGPELLSRAKAQFMVGWPSPQAQREIFLKKIAKYGLPEQPLPKYTSWSGREIYSCCETAYEHNCSLIEAANFVVPSAGQPETLERLLQLADNTYIDADAPGVWKRPTEIGEIKITEEAVPMARRKRALDN